MDKLFSCSHGSGNRVPRALPVIETGPQLDLFTTGICKRTGRRIGCKAGIQRREIWERHKVVTSPGWGE